VTAGTLWLLAVAAGGALAALLMALVVALVRLHEAEQRVRDKDDAHEAMLERLRQGEIRLRAIFESVPECVKLQAADGTVLDINPAGLRLLGAQRPGDIVGRRIYAIVAPEHQALYREQMRRVFAGESVAYEFRSLTLAGRSRWMHTHAVPLRDARGGVQALLGITRDVTEDKQAEAQARQHQTELARVARLATMGEMATGIAHELNQPLAAIANFARGSLRRLRSGDTTAAIDLAAPLEEICQQAERAGEVIRHVRDFVRKREPVLADADLGQIVRSVGRFAEMEAAHQDVTLRLELAPALPRVRADAIMIEQVVGNLVRNAIEAMAEARSEPREVSVRVIARERARDAAAVEIEVADTGPGIDAVRREQVFDPFFTTKPEGMGMGLSISRSIVEAHGGGIHAGERAGGGAAFVFWLPAAGAPQAAA
jgi:PAS domain S-box-containing protein